MISIYIYVFDDSMLVTEKFDPVYSINNDYDIKFRNLSENYLLKKFFFNIFLNIFQFYLHR